ncbi:MAG: nucleotidyltransferase [Nitrososphaerales archaeon]
MNLESEAIQLTKDLGEVVFVGAFAVIAHIGGYRQTRDLDLAVATPISEVELERLGYPTRQEGRNRITRTPGGVKIDIYTRDVGGIPIEDIFRTAADVPLRKGRIRVMGLEALLLAKLQASRPQDIEDIRQIVRVRAGKIDWEVVRLLASDEVESANLKNIVAAISGARVRF